MPSKWEQRTRNVGAKVEVERNASAALEHRVGVGVFRNDAELTCHKPGKSA